MTSGKSVAPLVTIGLPVYNGGQFLATALDSLLGQTFTDFELIISDNASTDATEEICREYARADARVRYRRSSENRGFTWNANRVVELAAGKFFRWAAHDDACLPTFLERCVETLRSESPSVVLAYPRSKVINEHGAVLWEHWDRLDLRDSTPHKRLLQLVRNPPNMGTSIYGLMRTSALRQTRGLGDFPSHDYVLLAELALLGEFREIPELLFLKRYHASMSREANPTLEALADWIKPGSGNRVILEYWNLFFEHLASIHGAPLGLLERTRCYAAFVPMWARYVAPTACNGTRGVAERTPARASST